MYPTKIASGSVEIFCLFIDCLLSFYSKNYCLITYQYYTLFCFMHYVIIIHKTNNKLTEYDNQATAF